MIKLDLEIKVLLMTFVISVICGLITIPILKKLKVGQIERDDGPESHLKKQGTPTMGGIIIMLGIGIVAPNPIVNPNIGNKFLSNSTSTVLY